MPENNPTSTAPRRLLLLRHAKSSWSDPGLTDFERILNARGQRDAPLIGQKLRQEKIDVDIILASTAQRVRETLALLITHWQIDRPIVWEKQLYLADPETICNHLAAMDENWSRVMIVGHNPGLSETACLLTSITHDMPTASVVMLSHPIPSWSAAIRHHDWHEYAYWKPKEIA